jgi:hypothetical protein
MDSSQDAGTIFWNQVEEKVVNISDRKLDSMRIINALRASENANNQWFKDYWCGVATKISQKYA